jgi:AcrR family transcriptional regulator
MAVIAQKARVNKALIHYYYKNKKMLYFEVIKNIFGGHSDIGVVPVFTGSLTLTPAQQLYVMLYFLVNSHLRGADPETIKIFFWEVAEGEKYLNYFMEQYTAPRHMKILEIIRAGIAAGEFETVNPELVVVSIFSFITFYTIDIKLSGGETRYFFDSMPFDPGSVLDFVLNHSFKALQPGGRPFTLPTVPADFMAYVDELLEVHITKKEDGVMGLVIEKLEQMIS